MLSPTFGSVCVRCSTARAGGNGRSRRGSGCSISIPIRLTTRAFSSSSEDSGFKSESSDIYRRSLRLIEWDKLCDSVASFAGTSLGQQAVKEELWYLNRSYDESVRLLEETSAAVRIHSYGDFSMDFSGINVTLVNSSIQHVRRGLPVLGSEAIAVVGLLQFADTLQSSLRAAIKVDADWYARFMPLSEKISELSVNKSLIKFIEQIIDEDGSAKDSASAALKQSRDQVRALERKLYQLLEGLICREITNTSSLEVCNVDGRWCLRTEDDVPMSFAGIFLPSGSGSIIEPVSVVPLNDELQQARATAAKAETAVLLKITDKMQADIEDIANSINSIIRLDAVNAKATYSISYGGSYPEMFSPEDNDSAPIEALRGMSSPLVLQATRMKWTLYLPKSYHPLLLEKHRQSLNKAIKELHNANAEIRRKQQGGFMVQQEEKHIDLLSLELKVSKLKQSLPVPVDIFVAQRTRGVVITGPNTGGKTICLKTIGLAAMMAKSGLYVLSSEPARIPWFDYVFADIGDEQSLSQSLSTFSGHLKQISDIQAHSSSQSLVLLDEVGSGTNPLEGAALGMSLLESFVESGSLLTVATTHHGELKTLKYSNDAFENACMEYDEESLKPTYRILWGVPGSSNALNIATRLGLPDTILHHARELYGTESEEINEVIVEMERFKQNFHAYIHEARHYLMLSKKLHDNLHVVRRKVTEHGTGQRYRKVKEISEAASKARSVLHKKVCELRTSVTQRSQVTTEDDGQKTSASTNQQSLSYGKINAVAKTALAKCVKLPLSDDNPPIKAEKGTVLPKIGDVVYISYLNKRASVLKVEPSRGEIVVQAGNMKLKVNIADVII